LKHNEAVEKSLVANRQMKRYYFAKLDPMLLPLVADADFMHKAA